MRRIYHLLQQAERPLFLHVNIRWHRSALNGLFLALSIIGGAVFSLTFSLLFASTSDCIIRATR